LNERLRPNNDEQSQYTRLLRISRELFHGAYKGCKYLRRWVAGCRSFYRWLSEKTELWCCGVIFAFWCFIKIELFQNILQS